MTGINKQCEMCRHLKECEFCLLLDKDEERECPDWEEDKWWEDE